MGSKFSLTVEYNSLVKLGKINFDPNKPDGTPRKFLNSEGIFNLGFKPKISLKEGLIKTYQEYLKI